MKHLEIKNQKLIKNALNFYREIGIDITSGEILYIDNRASITRDTEQTEDLKVVVQL